MVAEEGTPQPLMMVPTPPHSAPRLSRVHGRPRQFFQSIQTSSTEPAAPTSAAEEYGGEWQRGNRRTVVAAVGERSALPDDLDPHRLEHRRRTRKRRPATQRVRALHDAPRSRAQEDVVDIGLASGGETDRELAGALDADVGVRALRAVIGQTSR